MSCEVCGVFAGPCPLRRSKGAATGVPRRTTPHHLPVVAWRKPEESGQQCYVCDILVRGCRACFRFHGIDVAQIDHCNFLFYYQFTPGDDDDIDKEITVTLKDGSLFDIQIFVTEDGCPIPPSWAPMPVYDRTVADTGSDLAVAKIQDWIQDCLGDHADETYCGSTEDPILPTRIIDVGLSDGIIRLEEGNGRRAKYITLSHCWGDSTIIRTTQSSISQWKSEIPMKALSPTFRDAVLLTRKLGIAYLWIDSLCIIQGDIDDWKREAAKMASVYSYSHLTLAATHARNGNGGLFTTRFDYEVTGVSPRMEPYRIFFRQKVNHHLDARLGDARPGASQPVAHHPLLTRAWVFQERLLSARVLHFGQYEMFWECRSVMQCECGGIMYLGSSASCPQMGVKLLLSGSLESTVLGMEWHVFAEYYIARFWRTMVCSYMNLDITKSDDRLPAIGGLARHMAQRRKSRYFAGVWDNSINDDLLWVVRVSQKEPRAAPLMAPTWSWASVGSAVSYWDEILVADPEQDFEKEEQLPYQHFTQIGRCEVVPDGPDEYGRVKTGTIEACGLVVEGTLQREVQDRRGKATDVYHVAVAGIRVEMMADYSLRHAGHGHVADGAQLLCLRMSQIQEGLMQYLISLVLRFVRAPNVYERIGAIAQEESLRPGVQSTWVDIYSQSQERIVAIV